MNNNAVIFILILGLIVGLIIGLMAIMISRLRLKKQVLLWHQGKAKPDNTLKSEGSDLPKKGEVPYEAKSSEEEPPSLESQSKIKPLTDYQYAIKKEIINN